MTRADLKLDGSETFDVTGLEGDLKPLQDVTLTITRTDGKKDDVTLLCRIDTEDEIDYMKNGGILHYVLRDLASVKSVAA
jgi:aconitate hydratase